MRTLIQRAVRPVAAFSMACLAVVVVSMTSPAMAETKKAVEAGPIWNQSDAENKCPALAKKEKARWNGQWWTTVQGKMSVCELVYGIQAVEAGPIWNQGDADTKCKALAKKEGGHWTGQWWTTVQGQMSVCQLNFNLEAVEAGPIWNQGDADNKCPALASREGGKWTGHWWTTVQGRMSVCQIAYPDEKKEAAKPKEEPKQTTTSSSGYNAQSAKPKKQREVVLTTKKEKRCVTNMKQRQSNGNKMAKAMSAYQINRLCDDVEDIQRTWKCYAKAMKQHSDAERGVVGCSVGG